MGTLAEELIKNTVGMFRNCKSQKDIASHLGISEDRLVNLIELWDMISCRSTFSSPGKDPARLKSQCPSTSIMASPSKFMDPGKLEVGKFIGNVQNDGVTGEFDGFNFSHSKIMLNVSGTVERRIVGNN